MWSELTDTEIAGFMWMDASNAANSFHEESRKYRTRISLGCLVPIPVLKALHELVMIDESKRSRMTECVYLDSVTNTTKVIVNWECVSRGVIIGAQGLRELTNDDNFSKDIS